MLRYSYFCISLETAENRRALMAAEFAKADIDVSFFNAVVVPNTNNDAIAKAEGVKLGRYARRLTRGELGCYFSYRRLWEQLLQSDEDAYVIFEDDMVLDAKFKQIVHCLMARTQAFEVVRLGPLRPHERSHLAAPLDDERGIYWTKRTALGMGCYAITRDAARALLLATETIIGPVDYDVDRCWTHGKKVQLVYPVAAYPMDVPSTIGERVSDDARKIGFHEKWWRRATKHRYRISVTLQRYNAQYRRDRNKRGAVQVSSSV